MFSDLKIQIKNKLENVVQSPLSIAKNIRLVSIPEYINPPRNNIEDNCPRHMAQELSQLF